jgi:guanine deaminase
MLIIGRPWTDFDDAPPPGWVRVCRRTIEAIGTGDPPPPRPGEPVLGDPAAVIVPGFTDAHVHLPQFHQRGIVAPDLLAWLEAAIFPAEARWADADRARAEAEAALAGLLRAGTVRAAAFLTAHASAADAARLAAERHPVDLLAGISLMDREAPPGLCQPAGEPPVPPPDTADGRVRFSVNPRFAVSCTETMLAAAGELGAAATGRVVHTHLAEQPGECRRVAELFPADPSYTAVYDRFGLLHPRTLLAHAIHLSPDEWALIARRGATIVHCPGANTFLGSGLCDLRTAREHGIRIGLGSDVAAGPDIAMPRVARAMIEVATLRRLTVDPDAWVPSPAEAWRMITRVNAACVGRPDAGRLTVGAAADLLLLHPDQPLDAHTAGRLLHAWDDDWITARVVGGVHLEAG